MQKISDYQAIVIGVSAGGIEAMPEVIKGLPADYPLPIILVQHSEPNSDFLFYCEYLQSYCSLIVKVADEKEKIQAGRIYIAPANYHLLVEEDYSFSLNIDQKVNYSRPSIDVLFESAVAVYGQRLIGIILTGANCDGTNGMRAIVKAKGLAIVQDPAEAATRMMPQSIVDAKVFDRVLSLSAINKFFMDLSNMHKISPKSNR